MPTKEHLFLTANTNTQLVKVNPNRVVLTICNMDPGSVVYLSDKAPSKGTGGIPVFPYGSRTFRRVDKERPDRDWWGLMTPAGGRVAILEEMEQPETVGGRVPIETAGRLRK